MIRKNKQINPVRENKISIDRFKFFVLSNKIRKVLLEIWYDVTILITDLLRMSQHDRDSSQVAALALASTTKTLNDLQGADGSRLAIVSQVN